MFTLFNEHLDTRLENAATKIKYIQLEGNLFDSSSSQKDASGVETATPN